MSVPPVTIRPAVPEDLPTLVEFQLAMARESEDLALDPATLEAGVRAVFEDPAKGRYWVAAGEGGAGAEGDGILGSLLTTYEWSDWRNATVLWIQSVYVRPAARGRGVYRALYRHLEERVRADPGLAGIRLYVDRGNVAAQRVYERLGMSREHYLLYEWLKGRGGE